MQEIADPVVMTGEEATPAPTKRPRGRPRKERPDAIFMETPVAIRKKLRKAQLTAALAYLYYAQGGKFVPEHMPMNRLEILFGVTRHTIYRCVDDVRSSVPIAEEMLRELEELSDHELKTRAERDKMNKEADRLRADKNRIKRSASRASEKAARLSKRASAIEVERRAMSARHKAKRESQREVLYSNGLRQTATPKRQAPLRRP